MRASLSAAVLILAGGVGSAQSSGPALGRPQIQGACVAPSAANLGAFGCYFDAAVSAPSGRGPLFYHLIEYPDRRAAERAKRQGSAVVHAYGRWFLTAVDSDPRPRASNGRHVTTIGPMDRPRGGRLIARFMQAMTRPGASTQPHSHDGPEAFHVLTGAICMESPMGAVTTAAGGGYWIGGHHPMQLTSVGKEVRRSLFVVIHPAGRPWMNVNIPWKPKGRCQP